MRLICKVMSSIASACSYVCAWFVLWWHRFDRKAPPATTRMVDAMPMGRVCRLGRSTRRTRTVAIQQMSVCVHPRLATSATSAAWSTGCVPVPLTIRCLFAWFCKIIQQMWDWLHFINLMFYLNYATWAFIIAAHFLPCDCIVKAHIYFVMRCVWLFATTLCYRMLVILEHFSYLLHICTVYSVPRCTTFVVVILGCDW